jgi:transcriptional regulator with XRE-family HTH domain
VEIAEKIRRYLDEEGVTAEALAIQAGYSQSTLSFLLSGRTKKFAYPTLIKTARAMGVTVEALIDEEATWPLARREGDAAAVSLGEEEQKALNVCRVIASVVGWNEVLRRIVGGMSGPIETPIIRTAESLSPPPLRKRG